jgi:hypothetical protein
VIGVAPLFLAACGAHYAPLKLGAPPPADVPDAALVAPCDRANADPATNLAMSIELNHNRKQRDDCASRMDGVAQWRADALKRADAAAKAAASVKAEPSK